MIIKKMSVLTSTALLVIATAGPLTVVSTDAEAKGFRSSSSSFSRSSFRSSSSKSSGKSLFSSFKSKPRASKSKSSSKKFTTKKSTSTSSGKKFSTSKKSSSSKFGNTKTSFKSVSSGAQTKQAKVALNKQRGKFKKPVYSKSVSGSGSHNKATTNAGYKKTYGSNPTYRRASSYDRGTYYSRRNSYYGSYNPPMYVYNSSPSYGMWDTIFLYSMLNNMNSNSHAAQFSHNHQNDADYRAWRAEADSLAKDNAELRKQLAQLDSGAGKYKGQAIDGNYIPMGVDADLAMSQEVLASQKPVMRLCVGSPTGTYQRNGNAYKGGLNSINIITINTAGTGEVLEKIADGSCDAGMAQADGYWNYIEEKQSTNLPFERAFSTHKEAVHLFCHEDGPNSASSLSSKHTVWFPKGSGAEGTYKNWIAEDSDYNDIRTVINTPHLIVSSNEEAIMKVSADKNHCAMYVGAHGASTMLAKIDKIAKQSKIVLVNITDSNLDDTTDPSGEDVYTTGDMDKYKALNRQAAVWGMMSGDVDSLFVNADMLIATKWKKANKALYPTVIMDMMAMQPQIDRIVKK